MALTAAIHSVETAGALDGPGLRYVLFLRGCPFRCSFCHNPDTWDSPKGSFKTVSQVFADIMKYKSFFTFSKGGVTASGGEPTLHLDFLSELFGRLKKEGIHTALDTCGYSKITPELDKLLDLTDLVLLDIKHLDTNLHNELTGKSNDLVLEFLSHLQKIGKPVWIRCVIISEWTDGLDYAKELATFLTEYSVIKRVELLPYHDMGKKKWEAMGIEYRAENLKPPTKERLAELKQVFENAKIPTVVQ